MIQQQRQQTDQWVLTSVQFNLVELVVVMSDHQLRQFTIGQDRDIGIGREAFGKVGNPATKDDMLND